MSDFSQPSIQAGGIILRVKIFFGILFLVSFLGVLFLALTPYLYKKVNQNRYDRFLFYRPVWVFAFVALMIWAFAGWQNITSGVTHYNDSEDATSYIRNQYPIYDNSYKVIKVASGKKAQVKLNKGSAIVDLIGLDMFSSPDKDQDTCYKKQAADKLGQLLKDKEVELEGDDSVTDTDKSDALLRYLISDNKNINRQMITLGYAKASDSASYKYRDEFSIAEKESKSHKLGLWSGSICITVARTQPAATSPAADRSTLRNTYSGSRKQVKSTRNDGGTKNPKEDSGSGKDDSHNEDSGSGSSCIIKLPLLGCL